jgi:predicted transcriptional regulator
LTHLFNLAKLSKLGFNLIIILWDMNILSNPYFKKVEFEKYKQWTSDQYINKKKEEIIALASALGVSNFKVYNSSDLWTRFLQQKEKALFTKYYSVLSTMDLDEYNLDEKLNYLIQLPADVFFANFFQELFSEDIKKPIEVMYSTPQRKMLYFATRKAMHNEGLTSTERPIIILSKEIPRIEIDSQIPHWDMTTSEINQLISRWQFEKEDIKNLYQNVLGTILPEVTTVTKTGAKIVNLEKAIEILQNESRENIVASTSKNLFTYFQNAKEITKSLEEPRPDFHTVKTKKELKQLSALLKSENIMKIIVLANGTRTISEIAKDMNMQLSNTSQYITKLKKAGLITIKNKKVTRTAKGLKVNFEVSLGN